MRHRDAWELPVSYGAVGATRDDDLLRHPPTGFHPIERRVRLGSGDARWEYAWHQTLTWGIQKNSGFRVELQETPAAVTDFTYTPVAFDEDGIAVTPATTDAGGDTVFSADGEAFLRSGDTAHLLLGLNKLHFTIPVRVVYVIDEPNRKGFGYGTLEGHPESGEEAWVIDRTEDGAVWLTIRAFSRPSRWYWWAVSPALFLLQWVFTRRYERALAGPID